MKIYGRELQKKKNINKQCTVRRPSFCLQSLTATAERGKHFSCSFIHSHCARNEVMLCVRAGHVTRCALKLCMLSTGRPFFIFENYVISELGWWEKEKRPLHFLHLFVRVQLSNILCLCALALEFRGIFCILSAGVEKRRQRPEFHMHQFNVWYDSKRSSDDGTQWRKKYSTSICVICWLLRVLFEARHCDSVAVAEHLPMIFHNTHSFMESKVIYSFACINSPITHVSANRPPSLARSHCGHTHSTAVVHIGRDHPTIIMNTLRTDSLWQPRG